MEGFVAVAIVSDLLLGQGYSLLTLEYSWVGLGLVTVAAVTGLRIRSLDS